MREEGHVVQLRIVVGVPIVASVMLLACQSAPNSSGEISIQLRDEVVRVTNSVSLPLGGRFDKQIYGTVAAPPFAQRWRLPSVDQFIPSSKWSYSVGLRGEAQVVAGTFQTVEGQFFCEVETADALPLRDDQFDLSKLDTDQIDAMEAAREGSMATLSLVVECRSKAWTSRPADAIAE